MTAKETVKKLEEIGCKFDKVMYIKKEFTGADWFNSEECKKFYAGWSHLIKNDEARMVKTRRLTDVMFYLTEDDRVFAAYTITDENLMILSEQHAGFSCISDSPFHEAIIMRGFIAIVEQNWKKCKENRVILAKQKRRVFSY